MDRMHSGTMRQLEPSPSPFIGPGELAASLFERAH